MVALVFIKGATVYMDAEADQERRYGQRTSETARQHLWVKGVARAYGSYSEEEVGPEERASSF